MGGAERQWPVLPAVTARAKPLDPAAPMRSLLAAAGDPALAELARRLKVRPASVSGYCDTGDRVQLSTLREAARVLGLRLVLGVLPGDG